MVHGRSTLHRDGSLGSTGCPGALSDSPIVCERGRTGRGGSGAGELARRMMQQQWRPPHETTTTGGRGW